MKQDPNGSSWAGMLSLACYFLLCSCRGIYQSAVSYTSQVIILISPHTLATVETDLKSIEFKFVLNDNEWVTSPDYDIVSDASVRSFLFSFICRTAV